MIVSVMCYARDNDDANDALAVSADGVHHDVGVAAAD